MVAKLAVARLARPDRFEDLAAAFSDELAGRLKSLRQLAGSTSGGFQAQALALEISRRQAEIRWIAMIRDDSAAIVAQQRGTWRRRPASRSQGLA
jgi:hypothetical protein